MKINLYYNDFNKNIDIDIFKKIGKIQEDLLNYCSLMIYNIEYTEIIIDSNSYILGDEGFDFNETLEKILINLSKNESNIEKIIIYDRKRDINGNVIKNNIIIDKYNKWFQEYENENYINNFNNIFNEQNYNRNIIRFPLSDLLTSILRYPINYENIEVLNENNETQNTLLEENENDKNQQNTLLEEDENNEIQNTILEENENNETQNTILEENENNETHNITPENPNVINNLNSELNSFINIFDQYLRNNERVIRNNTFINILNNDLVDLPDLIPINENYNQYNLFTINNPLFETVYNQEDVKIVLTEEQFNNIESVTYKDLNSTKQLECLICTEEFTDLDNIKKIKCNHLFHINCIKPWLCDESNKCPVCRIEVDKGIQK